MNTHLRKMRLAATALVLGILASHANAGLISTDYVAGSGDNWLTVDTTTQLQWLDLTLTVDQTYDDVRTGIWYQRGFRHATQAEVQTLFDHAGLPDGTNDPDKALVLIQLLGATQVGHQSATAAGLTGSDFFGNDVTQPVGTRFSALLGKVNYLDVPSLHIGVADFGQGHPFSDESSPGYGSFLVSSVPEPGAFAMVACGLAVLGFNVRGRKPKA